MPSYPNEGSIKRINDVIAVKFSSIAEARVIAELPIPKDIEVLQQNMYDIVSVGIINDNVVLECGTYDPQLYLSMQNPIGKYAGRPFVEITYTSSNAGLVQVFYDYGNGLSEEMSSRQTIEPVGEETTIRLPIVGWGEGKQLIGFRIDPPNGTRFVLINVKLLSSD
jgi:hypothetical protein